MSGLIDGDTYYIVNGDWDDPYLVAYDSTATTLFTTAPAGVTAIGYAADDTEGAAIEDLANVTAGTYAKIVFTLDDGYAWEDGTTSDRWYAFESVTTVVDLGTLTDTLFDTSKGWTALEDEAASSSSPGPAAVTFTGVDADGKEIEGLPSRGRHLLHSERRPGRG